MRNQNQKTSHNSITLTDDQRSAVEKIKDELFRGSGVATLKGYAGTGKTTILQHIIDELQDEINEVYLMAPTHKAAEVLGRKSNKEVKTVHSAFGLRPVWDGEGGYNFKKTGKEPIKFIYRSLVAVDEASMINYKLYNLLIKAKQQYNLKILFTGDPAQLPPVNHGESPALSHDGYMLTEIIRQGEGNPILETSMNVRENGSYHDFQQDTISNGDGVYLCDDIDDFFNTAINDFRSQEYKETGDHARVLAYKNETVQRYNDVFRAAMYGENAMQFVEGEWLVALEPWTPIDAGDYEPIIQNSEELVVEDRDIVRIDGWFVWDLQLSSSPSAKDVRRVKVLHESEEKRYNKKLDELKQGAIKKEYMWPEFYDLKEKFAKLDYSFAMTTHKAQGSTFNSVYMDLQDLHSCSNTKDRDSLVYVATTRPSNKLYILKNY